MKIDETSCFGPHAVGANFFNVTAWDFCDIWNRPDPGGELAYLSGLQYLTQDVGILEEYITDGNGTRNYNTRK